MQVLQILPKLTKLDNDDVVADERPDTPQPVPTSHRASANLHAMYQLSSQKPSVGVAEQPFLGANPVLEQVHQPAELQAALATPHQVLCPMYSNLQIHQHPAYCCCCIWSVQASILAGKDTQGALPVPHLAAAPSFRSAPSSEPSARALSSKPSFKAQDNISAKPPAQLLSTRCSSSSNVLYAVIALLGDLDAGSLQIVHAEASGTQIKCCCTKCPSYLFSRQHPGPAGRTAAQVKMTQLMYISVAGCVSA